MILGMYIMIILLDHMVFDIRSLYFYIMGIVID